MSKFTRLLSLAVILVCSGARAQNYKSVDVVRALPGWQCMALASSYGPQGTNAPAAPVYAGPDADAQQIGTAAGVIIVSSPPRPVNGRTEIIRPNGQKAWIAMNLLTQWHSLSDPKAVCYPALLSNGRYGFRTVG